MAAVVSALALTDALSACAQGAATLRVDVVIPSGLKQCDEQTPHPEPGARVLRANGIDVLASSCASDGARHAQMCGLERGLYYVYTIDGGALAKAAALGFAQAGERYRSVPCT